jgi:hypothetical protein
MTAAMSPPRASASTNCDFTLDDGEFRACPFNGWCNGSWCHRFKYAIEHGGDDGRPQHVSVERAQDGLVYGVVDPILAHDMAVPADGLSEFVVGRARIKNIRRDPWLRLSA